MASSTNPLASALAMPAGVDPSDYQAILDSQRKQMLAQALTQRALSGFDAPQPISGGKYTVAPRAGLVTALRPLADALAGNKASKDAVSGQAAALAQMANAYAPGGQPVAGTPLQAAPPPSDPNAQSVQPGVQRLPGQSLASTVQASMPTTTPINPRNPQGLPAQAVMQLAMSNPEAYTKYLQGTPDYQNALTAAGGDPNLARQLLMAEAQKKGSLDLRQGGEVVMPNGQIYRNPTLGAGQVLQRDANGNPVAVQNLPGYTEAAAASAGATTGAQRAAEAPYQYQNVPTQGGGSVPMSVAQLQARQGQPVYGPPGPRYFPAPPQSTGAATPAPTNNPQRPAAPGTPAHPDYWRGMPVYKSATGLGGQSTYNAAQDKAVVDQDTENYQKLGTSAVAAMNQSRNYALALPHLANATVGEGSDAIRDVRSLLAHTGFVPQDQLDKLSDTEISDKYLTRNGTEGLLARYGRVTQGEVTLSVNKQAPNLSQQQQAILKLTIADDINNAYLQQKATDYSNYRQQGGDPRQFETWYTGTHPIDEFTRKNGAAITARDLSLYRSGTPEGQAELAAQQNAPRTAAVPGSVPTATGANGQKLYLINGQWVSRLGSGASGSW